MFQAATGFCDEEVSFLGGKKTKFNHYHYHPPPTHLGEGEGGGEERRALVNEHTTCLLLCCCSKSLALPLCKCNSLFLT